MTHKQKQAFLQARAASSIQAITAALADDVSAITNGTQLQNASQQGSQVYLPPASVAVDTIGTPSANFPFGEQAAHGGRSGQHQALAEVASGIRKVCPRQLCTVAIISPGSFPADGPMALDSHLDTSCIGSNCAVLEYANKCNRL
jgi:hypothetical protein